jgi:hypothetical protein
VDKHNHILAIGARRAHNKGVINKGEGRMKIRNINPMVRAVATMGAIAALVGGVTYADLTSNTVKLTPNNLVSATAAIAIGAGTSCPGGDTSQTTGFTTASPLVPGGSPVTTSFCLHNTGNVNLLVSASIPTDPTGTAASDTTLSITCNSNQGSLVSNSQTLASFATTAFTNPLPAGAIDNCTASASLKSSYTGSGGEAIPTFEIDFAGTQNPAST